MKRRLTILGSTGAAARPSTSCARTPISSTSLASQCQHGCRTLRRQAAEFEPELVALESPDVPWPTARLRVLAGPGSSEHLAREPVDVVLNGIVGFAGLAATVGLEAGNRLALANKESLVAGASGS